MYAYTLGGRAAIGTVRPGEILRVSTQDCFGGLVRGPQDLPSQVCPLPFVNPVTGPFHVEGARPGDTLALHFAAITPARDWGVSATVPHFGALTSTDRTASLQPPLEERVWVYDIDTAAGLVHFRATRGDQAVALPLDPMHGTVGVAPAGFEVRSTLTCDSHGGNLDTPEIRAGATLYLGVNVDGALFSLGDGHARQGEGEACGTAVETAMETTLVVDLIPNTATPWPRIETDSYLISVGVARPLEDAYRIAHADMTRWIGELTGLEQLDAYQLLSQAGTAPAGNVVDPNYTMLAKIAKRWLPGPAAAYAGTHARLRSIAAAG
ncbi:acetamidase/formamidase [Allocatelliglobosispora scoriae]|uniref:Acetamidase/formamidase n=1 Tax=Allocatelliglobosispora scoriae TaxID=643052 RepID=A0A841BUX6_9ACTN|nr:acetamidase/formamidase family protein [Allocatelliglobosispora scoriae]MBB5872907.1 acetamidase/formamidase [Allocatelliglobosispora scoriae]